MLVIPIGLTEGEVRRNPWVTWAVIAANVVFFVAVHMHPHANDWKVELADRAEELETYWDEHPYLHVPADAGAMLGARKTAKMEKEIAQRRREFDATGRLPLPYVIDRQQEELQRLTRAVVDVSHLRPTYAYSFVPAHPTFVTAFSSLFTHSGLTHLLGNMLLLFALGPFLEDLFGRPLYLFLYLSSGLVAVLAQAAQHPGSEIPLMGASGAIAGVMGAFLVRLTTRRILYLFLPFPVLFWIRYPISVRAWVTLPFWFLEQLAAAYFIPDAGIAWWAHIGGFAWGLAAALVVRLSRLEETVINPAIESEVSWEERPELVAALESRALGHWEDADRFAREVLATEPANQEALRVRYDAALHEDRGSAGLAAARLVEVYAGAGQEADVQDLVSNARRELGEALPPRFHLAAASAAEKAERVDDAQAAYEALVTKHPSDPAAVRALLRLVELAARAGRFSDALAILELARAHPACMDAFRAAANGLMKRDEIRLAPDPPRPPLPVTVADFSRPTKAPIPVEARHPARGLSSQPVDGAERGTHRYVTSWTNAPGRVELRARAPRTDAAADRRRALTTAAAGFVGVSLLAGGLLAVPRLSRGSAPPVAGTTPVSPRATAAPLTLVEPERPMPRVDGAPAAPLAAAARAPQPAATAAAVAVAAPRAEPAAPARRTDARPASLPAPAPGAAGTATLRVSFPQPIARGDVMIRAGSLDLLKRTIDTHKGGVPTPIDEVVTVPSGAVDLKIWVIAADRSVNVYRVIPASFTSGASRTLELHVKGAALEAVLR